jgi:hypothetical protein
MELYLHSGLRLHVVALNEAQGFIYHYSSHDINLIGMVVHEKYVE